MQPYGIYGFKAVAATVMTAVPAGSAAGPACSQSSKPLASSEAALRGSSLLA